MQVKVIEQGGKPQIEIDGQVFSPLAFRSFRPEAYNIQAFYQSGVRLMSILMTGLSCTLAVPYSKFGEIWTGPGEYDFSAIDRQMELFLKNAPDAYFNIMLQLDTRDWYLQDHPMYSNTFFNLVEMAGVEQWRLDVVEYLRAVVGYIEEKYGEHVFSYSLFCGGSTEWYTNSQTFGNPEGEIRQTSQLKLEVFRKYMENCEAELPPLDALTHTSDGIFRDPKQDAKAIQYWKFHHNIIGDAIVYFAREMKNILQRQKLIGLFYGYIFELTDERLLYEGQLGYERVWKSCDIDMIFAPAAYGETRSIRGPSGFLHAVDSVRVNGEMTFHEIDHTTYIAPNRVESGRLIPGSEARLRSEYESIMVLRREFAMAHAKRVGMWWFDFFGGYYRTVGIMDAVAQMAQIDQKLQPIPMESNSEIAVFADVESMYYVSEFSKINHDVLRNLRDSLGFIGAPVDFYTLSDITSDAVNLDQYKLLILPNAFQYRSQWVKKVHERIRCNGQHILWLYAPGYIREDSLSVEGICQATGLTVRKLEGSRQTADYHGTCFGFTNAISPAFVVFDPEAETIAHYSDSEEIAVACKPMGDGMSYYSAVGNLPVSMLRTIAERAGVHIFCRNNIPLYANSRMIGIYQTGETPITLELRHDAALEEQFEGDIYKTVNRSVTLEIPKGATRLFMVDEEKHI